MPLQVKIPNQWSFYATLDSSTPAPAPEPAPAPAPAPVPAPTAFALGQRPFAATSSWNTPIAAGASYTTLARPKSTGYNYWVAWDEYSPAVIIALVLDYAIMKPGFTAEAISGDGGNPNGIAQEGEHLGIPTSTAMPAGLSPLGQKVFRALQKYGGFIIDVAGGCSTVRMQQNAYDEATAGALIPDMNKINPLLKRIN